MPVFFYVEDEANSRDIMRLFLESMGHSHITIWPNSVNFEQQLATLDPVPDVFFLDIHVLPYDGFDMLSMIRAQPHLAHRPIIALTASVMSEEVARLKQAGFDGVIAKPLDLDVFPDLINHILAGDQVWHIA